MSPSESSSRTFKSLFCEHFDCPPAEYEKRVLRCVLYRRARLLAPLLSAMFPNYFFDDFQFIADLGYATSLIEVNAEVAHHKKTSRQRSLVFLHRGLKLRVSGGKVVLLAHQLKLR